MPPSAHTSITQPVNSSSALHEAIRRLGFLVGASDINFHGTTISEFRAEYPDVLDRIDRGSLEVITRHSRRYVMLDEAQMLALVRRAGTTPPVANAVER